MDEPRTKQPNEKFCTECGTPINEKVELCVHCGVRQAHVSSAQDIFGLTPNGLNRLTAALLALFLGGFGAHKFYLGQIGLGILYLVFSWTGIPTLVGIIQGIILLRMSNDEFIRRYG